MSLHSTPRRRILYRMSFDEFRWSSVTNPEPIEEEDVFDARK